MVDAVDQSFYKYFVLNKAVKHEKYLASQLTQNYNQKLIVATQAARWANWIFQNESDAEKNSSQGTENRDSIIQCLNLFKW